MEKYSQDTATLRQNLINEESQLMHKMSNYMSKLEKTAEESADMKTTEQRLQLVRDKITEIDLQKPD